MGSAVLLIHGVRVHGRCKFLVAVARLDGFLHLPFEAVRSQLLLGLSSGQLL